MSSKNFNRNTIASRLLHPDAFPHPVTHLRLLETHISWVILTGKFAYKIKKPVQFDFVDYSSLDLRLQYCQDEIKLNRRFAPELYLDVVPIIEHDKGLVVGDYPVSDSAMTDSNPIEYAVRMNEFSQDSIVAARLDHPDLTPKAVELFGQSIATFHETIKPDQPPEDCGQPIGIEHDAVDNFKTLRRELRDGIRLEKIEKIEKHTMAQLATLEHKFVRRRTAGMVRHCHGDLHLKNIIQWEGKLLAFDGIEFNRQLQWIDVYSEIAFPVMDFVARGRADLAWRLLNSYLEAADDYQDMDVLIFYLVYRAMVRAKVTWLNPANHSQRIREESNREQSPENYFAGPWDKYLDAAAYFTFAMKPSLSITHGFSGSGKSTTALTLIEQEGGLRIRSDVERQRLAARFHPQDTYSAEMTQRVYEYLAEQARSVIRAGMPVVIDATFLKRSQREIFEKLASELKVEFRIVTCDAPFDELCKRINSRNADASEATTDVLEMQMKTHQPLTTDELEFVRGLTS